MRICSCTKRVCSKSGPCDVQKAVDEANARRKTNGLSPLENTPKSVNCALGMFYAQHKAETGSPPCRGCEPLIRTEIENILAGQACQGGV